MVRPALRNFRVFGSDETLTNRLVALFEVTKRLWDSATLPNQEFLARRIGINSENKTKDVLEMSCAKMAEYQPVFYRLHA